MIRTTMSCLAVASLLAMGCGSDPKPPPEPQPTGNVTSNAGPKSGGNTESDAGPVGIDDRIVKMCNLPEAHFDFDSAAVSEAAKNMLEKLADCFLNGAGKGKNMRIVGHADPRGETEYNFALGQRRAGSVAQYLGNKGLGEDRIATSSRGELDATGTEESGFSRDRKVEIVLAE
jgi:peptidoglycan-associated lipoprotein